MGGLGADAWFDDPAYKVAQGTFSERGPFILAKLAEHDSEQLRDVLSNLYRDAVPDPMYITSFEWGAILRYMGASGEEVKDVQLRMGRVWR